jgi:hypothetical protein
LYITYEGCQVTARCGYCSGTQRLPVTDGLHWSRCVATRDHFTKDPRSSITGLAGSAAGDKRLKYLGGSEEGSTEDKAERSLFTGQATYQDKKKMNLLIEKAGPAGTCNGDSAVLVSNN